ncbi:recombinase family protein [Streptomyces sioyaensis]|uniref:recombinase family protein n=1 Tax=Streptomyces sioyaensis TaxID=67364 RepID=UPI0036C0196E
MPLMTPRGRVEVPPTFHGRPRVVGAKRLSRYTDASTSVEVQEEMITSAANRIGGEIVGWAEDVDTSALKTTPWERDELSYWLGRPDEWDVMIWQRMDRAVRNMGDMVDLARYAKQNNGKRLIFASGPGGAQLELDFSSPMSELIMLILAFAAQLEGQTIMERNQGAAAHLQSLGRWPGGVVPYGWKVGRKTFADGKEGYWLYLHTDEDPKQSTADIRRQMVARVISGAPVGRGFSDVLRWLEGMDAITPKNHRALQADPPRELDPESRWRVTVVREMLLSPVMRGYLTKRDGTIVRDETGAPIMQAEAMLDNDTWHELNDALRLLENGLAGRPRSDGHELLGVLVCSICERNLVYNWGYGKKKVNGKVVRTDEREEKYRCNGTEHPPGVPGLAIRKPETLEWVSEQFLAHLGPFRRTQIVRTPGVDHRSEIADLEADVEELSTRLGALRGPAADAVMKQLQGRSDRLEKLRQQPVIPARESVVQLDRTWADDWNATDDWAVRGDMMRSVGVRLEALPAVGWRPDISERLRFLVGTHVDAEEDALEDARHQAEL